ncbi:AzlD domain-containing protein [Leeia sp. TBRC 13508]|uniref:AzlD domain-containing protein n=1 Tax=Leeia speluncae TaxID=2884804 RepID=A0ABS8D9K2_9NEIS|nr:AzlD domain-containing protein [Leeia speluncae]MCB6184899.1 AzlD domain-containing protein [Leeia speluncae]
MLHDKWLLWTTIILIGLGTFLPRSSFIVLGQRAQLPRSIQRALKFAPACALAGLILPDILLSHNQLDLDPFSPKIIATVVAVVTIMVSRSPWLPFITGMVAIVLAGYL